MGYRFKPGDFPFATTVNGQAVYRIGDAIALLTAAGGADSKPTIAALPARRSSHLQPVEAYKTPRVEASHKLPA